MRAIAQIVNVSNESETAGQYVKAGDEIEYKIKVTNTGNEAIASVNLEDKLSTYESIISVKSNGKELDPEGYEEEDNDDEKYITINDTLEPGQTKNYVITSAIDIDADNEQAVELENTATAYAYDVETGTSKVMHVLEPTKSVDDNDDNGGSDNNNSGNNSNNGSNNTDNGSNGSQTDNNQELKIISGVAWLDSDDNGQRDDNETLLQGIKSKII